MRAAIAEGRPVFPDGPWGRATLEVILAILESAKSGRDIPLHWQVPAPV
jgi:phthalate 4,5-cis-dihydrodiol dehydrogenase